MKSWMRMLFPLRLQHHMLTLLSILEHYIGARGTGVHGVLKGFYTTPCNTQTVPNSNLSKWNAWHKIRGWALVLQQKMLILFVAGIPLEPLLNIALVPPCSFLKLTGRLISLQQMKPVKWRFLYPIPPVQFPMKILAESFLIKYGPLKPEHDKICYISIVYRGLFISGHFNGKYYNMWWMWINYNSEMSVLSWGWGWCSYLSA